MILMSL